MYKILLILLLLYGCSDKKETRVEKYVMGDFQIERYLGEWREDERIDNSFEKGLTEVTAQYSIDEKGRIRVVNRGYDSEKNKYKEVRGYIKKTETPNWFKVSFFRPFYGDYIVLDIDSEYNYALVGGGSSEYLWILSRNGDVPAELRKRFIEKAKKLGYSYEKLQKY